MIWSGFRHVLRPVTGILTECWHTKVLDLNIKPQPFGTIRTLHLYCAGGESGPDAETLSLAATYISELGPIVSKLYREFKGRGHPDFPPCLNAVYVPYQHIGLYFIDFRSEYGLTGAHAIKTSNCNLGDEGLYELGSSDVMIAKVIEIVQNSLNEICESCSPEQAAALKNWIASEKIMGPEIVCDLIDFLQNDSDGILITDRLMSMLLEARRFLGNAG